MVIDAILVQFRTFFAKKSTHRIKYIERELN